MKKLYTFYVIHCKKEDRKYIGCASQMLKIRWRSHKYFLDKGIRTTFYRECKRLGYNSDDFYIEELWNEYHTRKSAVIREEEFIEYFDSRRRGFNGSWSRPKEQNGWYGKGASNSNFIDPSKNPSKNKIQKTARAVVIEGTVYPSLSHAARCLKIDRMLVKYRINSKSGRFSEWNFINGEGGSEPS